MQGSAYPFMHVTCDPCSQSLWLILSLIPLHVLGLESAACQTPGGPKLISGAALHPSTSLPLSRTSPGTGRASGGGPSLSQQPQQITIQRGSAGKTAAAVSRGQTKVSTFFPAVDGSSRDSEGSAGANSAGLPSSAAAMTERASAAALATIQGNGSFSSGPPPTASHLMSNLASLSRLSPVAETAHDERVAQLSHQLEERNREVEQLKEKLR